MSFTSAGAVRIYHESRGDDYGSETSRLKKYEAILSLMPTRNDVLDAGCGARRFRDFLPAHCEYTGIDILEGQNALDYHWRHDIVIANGLLYRVSAREGRKLLRHLWGLAREALIFTSLRHGDPGETTWTPGEALAFALALTDKVALRADYLPHDFAVAL